MKLLLVIPPNYTTRFSYPNLGIMYLAASLREQGCAADILDCQTEPDYMNVLARDAGAYDGVGFYVNYFSARYVRAMSGLVRATWPHVKRIAGGPLVNHKPEDYVDTYGDIIALGEGEPAIRALAAGDEISKIPGLVYRLPDGTMAANERVAGWVDLDALPFPDWNMVDYRRYGYTIYRKKPLVSMMTSRGCPNRCIYCTKLVHGHALRLRSVQNVVDEIERDHRKYGVREIHFMDDSLTASTSRFKAICEEIIRRGLNRGVYFGIPSGIRPDKGDQEMFDLMKRAGFYFTVIAIESADPDVSSKLRRGVDLSKIGNTIRQARRAGLIVSTFFIFGTPFDTRASMQRSADFACGTNANIISIFFMLPFPGTDLYDMLAEQGKIDAHDREAGFNYIGMKPAFEANDWSEADLRQITTRTFRRFYFSPRRIVMNLLSLPRALGNPFLIPVMLFKLLFHGTPVHEPRAQADK